MWTEVTTLPTPFAAGGRTYQVAIEGLHRDDGTWAGRIAFRDGANVRRTEQETSQPNRDALEYWASGLEMVYLEGAFQRSR
jgi:hypothetical protein